MARKAGEARRSGRRKAAPKRPARRGKQGSGRSLRTLLWTVGWRAGAVSLVALVALTAWLDLKVRAEFEGRRWSVPARLYARPLTLFPEHTLNRKALRAELQAAGYQAVRTPRRPGQYAISARRLDVHTREFRFWDGEEPERLVSVALSGDRVTKIDSAGKRLDLLRLEPALIGRIYPTHNEDRVLKRLDELPPELVAGLIAVEDRQFFSHSGISLRGIARAVLANVMAGGAVQGGSTLTQQLAKNFFLSAERTLWRKLREALIALILEARYDKETILAAYLNEIFLGQQGKSGIHGFGSAAWYYFARPVDELELHESALLIALARGASYYHPRRHPQRALERRNLVLKLMAEFGVISAERAAAAARRPLGVSKQARPASTPYPAFVDLVRRQLRRDYADADLRSEGLRIFTTLEPSTQISAERALARRLPELEKARGLPGGSLEGSVVVMEPASGQVLSLVGSRDPKAHGFNRALLARRPIGSLVKPAVYLTALEKGYSLDSGVTDAAVEVALPGGRTWRPGNYDGKEYGDVTLREALTRSLNLATVNLGLALGVEQVAETLQSLGVEGRIKPVPSLLLGTLELTPYEVAGLYQPLAADGFQVPGRAIREVTDADGRPLRRYPLQVRAAADAGAVAELRSGLEDVIRIGTARYAGATLPKGMVLAGKTGTTDGLRDSWFAGFGADRLAVVWVGRDDNRPAGLTGSSGALRVWTDLMLAAPPAPLTPRIGVHLADGDGRSGAATGRVSGGCEGDLLGGFIQSLLGSGCEPATGKGSPAGTAGRAAPNTDRSAGDER